MELDLLLTDIVLLRGNTAENCATVLEMAR